VSFSTALALTLLAVVFVLAATMANLLARITRLERFAGEVLRGPASAPVQLSDQPAPEAVRRVIGTRDDAHLVLLSPDCTSCDDAVEVIGGWPEDVRRATFLAYRDEPSDRFVAPPGVRVVPQARAVFDALGVRSTPAVVRVQGGLVTQRAIGVPGEPGAAPGPGAGGHTAGAHTHDMPTNGARPGAPDGPRRQEAS
jgi:hypothetical protein